MITSANFLIVVWFAFVTNYCQTSMREAQKSNPLPDDYIGAAFYGLLNLTTIVFGVLFVISLTVLIILFVKGRYFAQPPDQEIVIKTEN